MFHALRWNINHPMEFTNTHLRRMVVFFLAHHYDYFLPASELVLKSTYGEFEQSALSYKEYLLSLLSPSTWADEVVLNAISIMWRVPISLLKCDTLTHLEVRHTKSLRDIPLVLLFTGGNHYLTAGKSLSWAYSRSGSRAVDLVV